MAKDNYALKQERPDSYSDDEAWKWPSVEACPDPAKVLSPEKLAALKKQEEEAFERFKRHGLRARGTGKSTGANE